MPLKKPQKRHRNLSAGRVRVPWTDPSIAYPGELRGGSEVVFDLNEGFRGHLVSKEGRARLTTEAERRVKDAESKPELRGRGLWLFYRDVRLLSALAALSGTGSVRTTPRPILEDFAHTLATSDAWYFSYGAARPHTHGPNREFAHPNALGIIGNMFESWLTASGTWKALAQAGDLTIAIHEVGELPFAAQFVRLCAKHAPRARLQVNCSVAVDERVRAAFDDVLSQRVTRDGDYTSLDAKLLARAAAVLKTGRALRVEWRPDGSEGDFNHFRDFAASCAKRKLRIFVDAAPALEDGPEALGAGSVAFRTLDVLKSVQSVVKGFQLHVQTKSIQGTSYGPKAMESWVRDHSRSELLRIQLEAELEPKEPRQLLQRRSRVASRPHRSVKSSYDLTAVYNRFGRFCGEMPFVFAHLGELDQMKEDGVVQRLERPSQFILFPGSGTIVPVIDSTELYVAAISHFEKPSTTTTYVGRFDQEERDYAFRLLERLLSVQVLRFA